MRHTQRLHTLRKAVSKCLRRLRAEVGGINRRLPERQIEVPMCRITIDAHNTWSNFVRSYYLSGMYGTKRIGGQRIAVGGPGLTEQMAIERAILAINPQRPPRVAAGGRWDRREEPTWHDTSRLLAVCTALNFPNLAELQAALSSGSRVFIDLPVFRNYFAHRNHRTLAAAVKLAPRYGIPSLRRPSQILLRRPLHVKQALILEWMDHIELTVDYLCT